MKVVLTVFAPFIVAIILRLALLIIGLLLGIISFIIDDLKEFAEMIVEFETFSWDEAWFYWILVGIGIFFAELLIWNED